MNNHQLSNEATTYPDCQNMPDNNHFNCWYCGSQNSSCQELNDHIMHCHSSKNDAGDNAQLGQDIDDGRTEAHHIGREREVNVFGGKRRKLARSTGDQNYYSEQQGDE